MPKRGHKYPHTRELVTIALDQDMTQSEIASLCRTQQSTVSKWASGQSKAFTHVIQPLIEAYGHRLRRAKGSIYITHRPPEQTWEDSVHSNTIASLRALLAPLGELEAQLSELHAQHREEKKQLGTPRPKPRGLVRDLNGHRRTHAPSLTPEEEAEQKALEDAQEALEATWSARIEPVRQRIQALEAEAHEALPDFIRSRHYHSALTSMIDTLEQALREDHATGPATQALVRVMGPVIWRHAFDQPSRVRRRTPEGGVKDTLDWQAHERWVVHELSQGQLVLVRQTRRLLVGTPRHQWRALLARLQYETTEHDSADQVHSREDAGRWLAAVEGPMSSTALLARTDALLVDADPHAQATAPLLLRKRLAERGYDIQGLLSITTISPSNRQAQP